MSWVTGPDKMEEDVELEEGEAGYFKSNDDRSIDPDIALSYLDEKLQSVLGHFQKDFEGGVSAENLGAKFGGYGSFLPMYQRSPTIRSQPKSPQRVQTNITPSPDHLHREGAARSPSIPDATLHQRDGTAAPRITHSSHDEKVALGDDFLGKGFDMSSEPVVEKLPVRHQSSPSKPAYTTDQKTLKFRIKVSSDKAAQKNVAIYSGLGLISPSSSPGNSPGESSGIPHESRENPDNSPTHILQMLSALTVALEPLLSPLPDRFMNLLRANPVQGKSKPAFKDKLGLSARLGGDSSPRVGDQGIIKEKKTNSIVKCESAKEDAILLRVKENSGTEVMDSSQCGSFDEIQKLQSGSIDNTGGSLRSSSKVDMLEDPDKSTLMKNRKFNIKGRLVDADVVKDNAYELVSGKAGSKFKHQEASSSSVEKIVTKDPPLEFPENRSIVNGINFCSKNDSDISETHRDSKGVPDGLVQKAGPKATANGQDKSKMADHGKKTSSEIKKNSKVSQVNGKISSHSVDDGTKAGISTSRKEKRSSKKETSKARDLYEDLFGNSEAIGCSVDPLEKPSSDGSKGSIDTVKDEHKQGNSLKLKSSRNKVSNQQTSEPLVKDSINYSVPPNGLPFGTQQTTGVLETTQAPVAPLCIEDWVCCDRCQRWRLLPYGRKPDQLPEKWVCTMLDWLPGMNRCDIEEDETTKALQALYQLPVADNQNSGQYHADTAMIGVKSTDAHHSYPGHPNIGSYNVAHGSKNKHKAKETSVKASKQGRDMTSNTTSYEQGPVNDKKQPSSRVKSISNSVGQHHNSSDNVVEKQSNDQKLDHISRGEATLKRNLKRVSDQYEPPIAKKIKNGRTSDIIDSPNSIGSLGRIEFLSNTHLPSAASMKDKQKSTGCSHSKDAKSDGGIVLQPSVRKLKEDVVDTTVGGSFDSRRSSDSHMSLKKRKLMDWQNSQNSVSALKNDEEPQFDDKIPLGENSDSGVRRNKKSVISQTDGNLFSRKGSDEVTQEDMKSNMLLSAVKDSRVDKDSKKGKGFRDFKIKVTVEDLESLKKELASEQLPTAATSSSSKVSDSRKSRAHYLENRGSPVESVSSSPLRMPAIDRFSPLKTESLSHNDGKEGDFRTAGSTIKIRNGNGSWDTRRSAKARMNKPSGIGHPESFNNCEPDIRVSEGTGKFNGIDEVGHTVCQNGCQEGNRPGTFGGSGPCLTEQPHSEPYYDQDRNKKKHYPVSLKQKSRKASSMLPKDKERSSDLKPKEQSDERVSPPPDRHRMPHPKKNSRVVPEFEQTQVAPPEELGVVNHQKSISRSVKSSKVVNKASRKYGDDSREDRLKGSEHENSVANLNQDFPSEKPGKISALVDCGDEKPQVNRRPEDEHDLPSTAIPLAPEDQKKNLSLVHRNDVSGSRKVAKESKDFGTAVKKGESFQGSALSAPDGPAARNLSGPSFLRSNASVQSASLVLKEAESVRDYADRLKETGFGYECNETYFQAALKFLQGAALLEGSNGSSKSGEMNQMQTYISSAKLCETCAEEYERLQEMAAAALAYKCMEVAYMRVVYCKNVTANRLCHDLQASLQMVSQGESPSSSASDVENLNNHALVDKSSSSRSNGNHVGSHILASRSRLSFARLLDFTKDVTSAMEASRKSQSALAAANVTLEEAQNKEAIVLVKRVIDFSFQDVEELVRLVWLAKEAINRKALVGSRN